SKHDRPRPSWHPGRDLPTPILHAASANRAQDTSHAVDRGRAAFITLLPAMPPSRLSAVAHPSRKTPRIGVLLRSTPPSFALRTEAFGGGLGDLGYGEGQSVAIEWKWGEDKIERFPQLAAELVKANVDVIVTGGTSAATALKRATTTIPIVMA